MNARSRFYEFGPYLLDAEERTLLRGEEVVSLMPKTFDTLLAFVEQGTRVLDKNSLLQRIWPDSFVEEANLAVNVSLLRKALGERPGGGPYIETVPKRGYRFAVDVRAAGGGQAPTARSRAVEPVASHDVRYARSGGVNIAYQVVGDGPIDLVFVMGWISHLEYFWKNEQFARFLSRLASFSRLILFDKRGTGLSDRVPDDRLPSLEQRMDDVRAVMEAAGSEHAALVGVSEGGPMCSLFAATYPERTDALVMIGSYARRLRADDYPWGPTREQRDAFLGELEASWGGPVGIEERAPSLAADPAFRKWWAAYLRMGASPGAAVALTRMNAEVDVRAVLPSVRVPTLVIHRTGDRCLRVEEGRYLAGRIPGAKFVELPGDDHLPFVGDQDAVLDEIEEFLTGAPRVTDRNRVLATVLSVPVDAPLSPEAWRSSTTHASPSRFIAHVRREVRLFRGTVAATDVSAASIVFDGPARAIRCTVAILEAAGRLGVDARAGVHTGECDVDGDEVSGLAVLVASQVAERARAGEVLVSGTVRDIVVGSGIELARRGSAHLEGLGEVQLFGVEARR